MSDKSSGPVLDYSVQLFESRCYRCRRRRRRAAGIFSVMYRSTTFDPIRIQVVIADRIPITNLFWMSYLTSLVSEIPRSILVMSSSTGRRCCHTACIRCSCLHWDTAGGFGVSFMRSMAGATATLTLCPEELVRWGFRREAGIGTTDGGTAADCGCCDGTRAL